MADEEETPRVRASTLTKKELRQLRTTVKRHFLTPAEWDDAMRMLIDGASPAEVGATYGVAPGTVVRRRAELVAKLAEEDERGSGTDK